MGRRFRVSQELEPAREMEVRYGFPQEILPVVVECSRTLGRRPRADPTILRLECDPFERRMILEGSSDLVPGEFADFGKCDACGTTEPDGNLAKGRRGS